MELDAKVIAREEKDGMLLYHGDNGGLIRLDKPVFEKCIVQDMQGSNGYEELYDWLFKNDFLKKKPPLLFQDDAPPLDFESEQARGGFFDLRSDKSPLNVLWALTARCNLRCIYCFPDAKSQGPKYREPATDLLLSVADKIVDAKVLKVTLSGGECFLAKDLWKIVERLRASGTSVAMISNGTMLTSEILENLKKYSIHVGISLDAPDEKINRITRGPNVFAKSVGSIKTLVENGVPTSVMITLTRYNFPVIEEHLELVESLGIVIVNLQDLRPFGDKEIYDRTRLSADQEKNLRNTYVKLTKMHPDLIFNPTELFIFSKNDAGGNIMQCPAGDHFAYIDFFGDMYPCTHLPSFKLGNLFGKNSLTELWRHSDSAKELRRIKEIPLETISACGECLNNQRCEGGCRGDALFYDGDLFGLPSRCPKRLGILE